MKKVELGGISMGVLDKDEVIRENAVILVMRQSDVDGPAKGSGPGHCARCEAPIWVHPTSVQHAPKAAMICQVCFIEIIKAEEN